jgi:hypothetical protein
MICEKTPYRLQLVPHLLGCPEFWIRFIDTVNPDGYSKVQVDTVLQEVYHAVLRDHVVTFDSHEDYMMFLMNWS